MEGPPLEVADIFRSYGQEYRRTHHCSKEQLVAMHAIEICRTAELGGHVDRCESCGYEAISYNSCRNRHCPKCGWLAREKWLQQRQTDLLPVSYFHVVFTVPEQIARIALQNKRAVYNILFAAVSETLQKIGSDAKHLGARMGFLAVLHTWGQTLSHHPHIHCLVVGGGLSEDGSRWIGCKGKRFLLPLRVLSKMFRGKFLAMLKVAFKAGELKFHRSLSSLNDSSKFIQYLQPLYSQNWIIYCKPPFAGPQQVLRYLGRYTHRIAISNDRLLSIKDHMVSFRYKDYRDGAELKIMQLETNEFIRRFLMHVLPTRFVRVRYYGFLANAARKTQLLLCRRLLDMVPADQIAQQDWKELYQLITGQHADLCPCCKTGRMITVEALIPLRPAIDSS